jgi:PAS domain S-box-containing protein
MNDSIKILFIEDIKSDAELIWHQIKNENIQFTKRLVERKEDYLDALVSFNPDIIISDYSLPHFDGMQALLIKMEMAPGIPFILVTGSINERVAVDCMKAGADDYIIKENLSRLGEAIKSALNKKEIARQKGIMEKMLKENEEKYRLIVDHSPDAIIIHSGGKILFANPTTLRLLGAESFDSIKDIPVISFVHPDFRDLALNRIMRISETGEPSDYAEEKFLKLNSEVFDVEVIGIPITYLGKPAVQVIIRDISRRKLIEEKLIESETYYRTLLDISPDAIITADLEGIVTYGSKNSYEIFGEPPDDRFIGTSVLHWLDPEESHRPIMERFMDIINGNTKPVTGIYKLLKYDRSAFWAEVSSCPIIGAKGNINGLLIICRDISDRKKAEEELIRARDKAEEGDRLKTAFINNISHEVRTPMNAITGFAALLGEPDISKETQKSYIEIINQSSDHLLDVLTDIIEISNIEAGILKLKKNEINLNSLLAKLFRQFTTQAYEKGLELKLGSVLSEKEANIITDNAKLIQILSNLISNALKFTLHGEIEFGCSLKNGKLEFYVSDTGIGIAEEQHQKIFNRFYQVEHSDKRQLYEGTGLGLSISKEYVELMKGKIWLTSKPDSGSVFCFTIPYEQAIDLFAQVQPGKEKSRIKVSGKKTILIAEDDDSNFYLIKEFLAGLNIEIIRACNGVEAVDICHSDRRIDLVLMDIEMPVMDGYTAIGKILAHSPDTLIIAQTAYASDEEKSTTAGCVGFISKPFSKKQFVNLIVEHMHI